MNFDVQDISLVEAIERTGSFSAAAEELYRTRSAITQHVKKLEDQVGFLIFDRSAYRPTLTEEGRFFLERGRPLLRHLERLKSEVKQLKEGWELEFSIAVDDVIPVENIFFLIEEFQKIAPTVSLRITREVLNGCWDALHEERAMLAIGVTGEAPLELICNQQSLGMLEFVFAVAKDHPLINFPQPLTSDVLEKFPSIVVSDTSYSLPKRTAGFPILQTKIIVPTMDTKIQGHVQGLGIGNLPRFRIQHLLDEGRLVELEVQGQTRKKGHFKIAWPSHVSSPSLSWFLKAFESEEVLKQILRNIPRARQKPY